jgi:phosphate transport system permease protein
MSNFPSKIGKGYVFASTCIASIIIFLILAVTFVNSTKALFHPGFSFFKTEWNVATGLFGILPMLFGTAYVTAIALTLAGPIGVLCALYISEVLPQRYRLIAKTLLELLAGIPSIIYRCFVCVDRRFISFGLRTNDFKCRDFTCPDDFAHHHHLV